jgi:hypothetical protein
MLGPPDVGPPVISRSLQDSLTFFRSDALFPAERDTFTPRYRPTSNRMSVLQTAPLAEFKLAPPVLLAHSHSVIPVVNLPPGQLSLDCLHFHYWLLRPRNKAHGTIAYLIDCDYFLILYIPALDESQRIPHEELSTIYTLQCTFAKYEFQIITSPIANPRDIHLLAFATVLKSDPPNAPPVNRHTETFYSAVVRDWRYLYWMAQLPHYKEEKAELLDGWIDAAGPDRVEMLFHFLIYSNFSDLEGPNLVFRSNTFLTTLCSHVLRKDQKFGQFLTAISKIDSDNAVTYFMDAFEKAELGPLTAHIVRCIFVEAKRQFPQSDACYFGVSGILFLRTMVPVIVSSCKEKSTLIMRQLQVYYNFVASEVDEADLVRLKKNIRDKLIKVEKRPVQCGELSLAEVDALVQRALGFPTEFFNCVNGRAVDAKYESFRQKLNDVIEI